MTVLLEGLFLFFRRYREHHGGGGLEMGMLINAAAAVIVTIVMLPLLLGTSLAASAIDGHRVHGVEQVMSSHYSQIALSLEMRVKDIGDPVAGEALEEVSSIEDRPEATTEEPVLLPTRLGSAFVKAYYQFSPPLADFIRDDDALRAAVRWSLLPLVGFSWLSLNSGVISAVLGLVIVLLTAALMVGWRVRKHRKLITDSNESN